jgi:hypothetical protein
VPAEFDLTAMPPALRVDAGDKTVELLFAGVPAAPTLEWAGRPPSALVALHVRDYTCLFRLDVRTARARKLGTLRWDARVQLQAGPMLQIYEDITVKFRGKSFTWEEAAAGIPVAWPVETLRFTVVGTAPSGRRNRSDFTIDLQAYDVLRRQL